MDEIRQLACHLAIQTPVAFGGPDDAIVIARKWDAFLREKVEVAESTFHAPDEAGPMAPMTEESVLAAMLGDHPEIQEMLRKAQGDLGGIEQQAEKYFDADD